MAAQLRAAYFDEMERERIEKLVRDKHGIHAICRGDILNGFVPV